MFDIIDGSQLNEKQRAETKEILRRARDTIGKEAFLNPDAGKDDEKVRRQVELSIGHLFTGVTDVDSIMGLQNTEALLLNNILPEHIDKAREVIYNRLDPISEWQLVSPELDKIHPVLGFIARQSVYALITKDFIREYIRTEGNLELTIKNSAPDMAAIRKRFEYSAEPIEEEGRLPTSHVRLPGVQEYPRPYREMPFDAQGCSTLTT